MIVVREALPIQDEAEVEKAKGGDEAQGHHQADHAEGDLSEFNCLKTKLQ